MIQRDPTQNLIFELKREIKKLREQNKQLQGAVMSSLAAINSTQPHSKTLQPSNTSRSSSSFGAGSEAPRRLAALQLHLFDSDSDNGSETNAPFARSSIPPPPLKAERSHAEDEPANADLISRTQWFLQMHQDKPQDTYEKLLFDELKTLVAEYSVTRKTSSLNPREGMSASSSKQASLSSSFGTRSKVNIDPSSRMHDHHQNMLQPNSGLGWDQTMSLQQRLATTASHRQQSSQGFGHAPASLKLYPENRIDSSHEEMLSRAVGLMASDGCSPTSFHGVKLTKRFGQDSSRSDISSHNGATRQGSHPIISSIVPLMQHSSSAVTLQQHHEGDDEEDEFDSMMTGNRNDQHSALLEIEQLKAELDRESAAFQGSLRMQQLHQVQQQQVLHQQLQQKPPLSLPLISENRGSPQRRDLVPDAELPRRRQHQRASQNISLSSTAAWPLSAHSPPRSRLQTSNIQSNSNSRSLEHHTPQRLVRSETGAAEKEGWKNRVNKAEAAIRNHMAEMSNWFGTK